MILSTLLVLAGAGLASARPLRMRDLNPSSGNKPVIIQLFEWNWNSVAQECTSFIGPAGYGYVQVSPPTESISGSQWWTSYQVVSYNLASKRGSRDEFAAMVKTCEGAGVGVIVDDVWNHMAGLDSGSGTAGTQFTHYNYPGLYQYQDFHHCGLTPNDDIEDWSSLAQVQTCELDNLADLNTESDYVRGKIADHANDLLSLGITGFRLDAAKHVALSSLENILSRLSHKPAFLTNEVIGAGAPVPPETYNAIGDVTVSDFSADLLPAFTGQGIASLKGFEGRTAVPSGGATVYVANHDTERGDGGLNYKSANNAYTLAHVFMLTYPYGNSPTVLSSYEFSNTDDGAPNGGSGTCSGAGGANGFLCQHRWTAIAGLVGFRNTVGGNADLQSWQQGSKEQIAFSRGTAGFVAINNAASAWSTTLSTKIPDGSYCDVVGGGVSNGACSGTKLVVSGGRVSVTVPAYGALAVYSGSKL